MVIGDCIDGEDLSHAVQCNELIQVGIAGIRDLADFDSSDCIVLV